MSIVLAEGEQGNALLLVLAFIAVNEFMVYLHYTFCISVHLVGDFAVQNGPKRNAELLFLNATF